MTVIKACYEYFDITGQAPDMHIRDVIENSMRGYGKEDKDLVYKYLDRLMNLKVPNMGYALHRLNEYIKTREFEIGAVEFVKLVEQGKFGDAQSLMYDVLKKGIEREDAGLDFFQDHSDMSYNENFLMPTGFKHLDPFRGGWYRGEFVCGLGGYKGKKSFSASYIGSYALMFGLNVLHVTHENSMQETAERYDREVVGLVRPIHNGQERPFYYFHERSKSIRERMLTKPSTLDFEARKEARKLLQRYGGRLFIKKYPMSTCTMGELERYLDYLERYKNFIPDVLINDYPEVMKFDPRKQTRDNINEIYKDHKRLADERNMLVITLSQATRKAIRTQRLKMGDFAEDIRKLGNVDTVYGVCQTYKQVKKRIGTIYIIAAREGEMDIGCGFVMNLDFGHFCTETFPIEYSGSIIDSSDEKEVTSDDFDPEDEDYWDGKNDNTAGS